MLRSIYFLTYILYKCFIQIVNCCKKFTMQIKSYQYSKCYKIKHGLGLQSCIHESYFFVYCISLSYIHDTLGLIYIGQFAIVLCIEFVLSGLVSMIYALCSTTFMPHSSIDTTLYYLMTLDSYKIQFTEFPGNREKLTVSTLNA